MTTQVKTHHGEMRIETCRNLIPGLQVGADAVHQRTVRAAARNDVVDRRLLGRLG